MEQETQNIVEERVKNLPKEVRDALASDEVSKKIQAIGSNRHLHIDQIGTMEDEVVLTMLGLSEREELASQLAEQLQIPKADAEALVQDIDQQIFTPLQEQMKLSDRSKSVVMPSAAAAAATAPTTPSAPVAPKAAALPPDMQLTPPSTKESAPAVHEADVVLTEPTVSLAPKTAPTPEVSPATPSAPATPPPSMSSTSSSQASPGQATTPPVYKADPYREPIE